MSPEAIAAVQRQTQAILKVVEAIDRASERNVRAILLVLVFRDSTVGTKADDALLTLGTRLANEIIASTKAAP